MDLKIVIRQLLEKGLSREQVISNLKELGVSDAEKLFEEAIAPQQKTTPLAKTQAPEEKQQGLFKQMEREAQPEKTGKSAPAQAKPFSKRKGELEINISDLVENQGKSLFREEEVEASEEPRAEIAMEEKAERKEEDESIEVKPKTEKSGRPPESLEEKIDEALALLKALESINEKILDTDRKLLLRTK